MLVVFINVTDILRNESNAVYGRFHILSTYSLADNTQRIC